METRQYWEENGHGVKYEIYNSNDGFPSRGAGCGDQLNFATAPSDDEGDYPSGAGYNIKKGKQDPMSHRIIEKRRRDRMNNCLADLSRLIPPEYLKKGRGRVEKTEIIEMAIRHLKYLQDRVNAAERQSTSSAGTDQFRSGYQEAVAEAARFLVEVQGYGPGDGLCAQLTTHLHRHCDSLTKDGYLPEPRCNGHPTKPRHAGSSSETTSSSSSSHGYSVKMIQRAEPPQERFDYDAQDSGYPMDCDRVSISTIPVSEDPEVFNAGVAEPMALDGRRKRELTLRTVRKPDYDNYLHSYKFKNSIERRFSRSQDCEAHDMSVRGSAAHKPMHKRRRARPTPPAPPDLPATSTNGSTDTSPQDTSSESPHHHYEKPAPPQSQYVPVFALNALGKYYVPLSVEYSCLARHVGAYDLLDTRAATSAAPLHPVTIHVNFQPCLNYHVKREQSDRDWQAEEKF